MGRNRRRRGKRDGDGIWLSTAATLERTGPRLLLSILILLSVSPLEFVDRAWWAFFAVFAVELFFRVGAFVVSPRREAGMVPVLVLDLVATVSFLPLDLLSPQGRLLRLARLMVLVGYWLPYVKELVAITLRPERWRQLAFVLAVVLGIASLTAILASHLGLGFDINANGIVEESERGFWNSLWWAFLQIESPDNIARQPSLGLPFLFSLGLTISGFFVFSFFIGIGASLVSELVETSRQSRVGYRNHFALINPSPDCELLLSELFTYYQKQLQVPKVAVLGRSSEVPEFLRKRRIRRARYRTGDAGSPSHLKRVDVERARRILLLKNPADNMTDAQVVSSVITVREMNPIGTIYAEVGQAESASAALMAGGRHTFALLTREFQGLILSNLIIFPGMREVLEEILSSAGKEIYSCLYGEARMAAYPPPKEVPPFSVVQELGWRYGVHLIGGFGAPAPDYPSVGSVGFRDLPKEEPLLGLVGVSTSFHSIQDLAVELASGAPFSTAPARSSSSRRRGRSGPEPKVPQGPPPKLRSPFGSSRRKVLVCGFREQTPVLLEQLARYSGRIDVRIMMRRKGEKEEVEEVLLAEARRGMARRRVSFRKVSEDTLQATLSPSGEEAGTIVLSEGDWSSIHDLEKQAFAHDVVVMSAEPGESDPDARTATGILKLASLLAENRQKVPPGFRVVGEVQDHVKAEVLARRFAQLPESLRATGVSIDLVSMDRLRNQFLAQAVMVPGITDILGELLSQGSDQLARLVPDGPLPDDTVDFQELTRRCQAANQGLPLAIELEGRPPSVSPTPDDPSFRFRLSELRSVYLITRTS